MLPLLFKKRVSEKIIDHDFMVPYYPESDESKVLLKVTSGSAGYDLYAAEEKNILPKSCAVASLDMRWAIPRGFYGKILSRSGLFLIHLITVEGGVLTLTTEELSRYYFLTILIKSFV